MNDQKTEAPADGASSGLALATGSADRWRIYVTVCGEPAGAYERATFAEAKKMADERNAKFGILGCHYRLIAPANECRCCGKPGVYVRTRYFATSSADVWECATEGCENRGLIWHTDSPNVQDVARPAAQPRNESNS